MITKKTKKNNTPTTTKQVAKTPKSKNKGILNMFFSRIGFISIVGLLLAMVVPTLAKADTITKSGRGTFITEEFDCKVALADYAELQRVLSITPRTDLKYKIFLDEFEATTNAMRKNNCKVK